MDEKTDMTAQHVRRGLEKGWEIELASTELNRALHLADLITEMNGKRS
jgi:hypothetical protein